MKRIKKIVRKYIGTLVFATVMVAGHNAIMVCKDRDVSHVQNFYEKYVKRPQDFFLASCAFTVFSPLMAVAALLVKSKLGSPILFIQDRPGLNGKEFRLYKFRTMTSERDKNGNYLSDDIRLTKFGRILRATSIDELPELINIIKGEMALVGPRPLASIYLPFYTAAERHRHDVRPGLTGLAQVNGRNNLTWDEKIAFDLEYVNNISFTNDMKIAFQTIGKVLSHEGIGQGENSPVSLHIERADWKITDKGAINPSEE